MTTIDETQGDIYRQVCSAASMVKLVMYLTVAYSDNACCFSEVSGKAIDQDRSAQTRSSSSSTMKQAYKRAIDSIMTININIYTRNHSFTSMTCRRSTARYTATSPTLNISSSGRAPARKPIKSVGHWSRRSGINTACRC